MVVSVGVRGMSVALAVVEPSREVSSEKWSTEQVRLIKETLTANLTDAEFELFAQVCYRTGLDPFTRQIYAIKRRQRQNGQWVERMTIQTGIDGYRVTAERTGEYVGGDAPKYGAACKCKDDKLGAHPVWAEVTVRRMKGEHIFTTAERADFHEYAVLTYDGHPQGLWAKMPRRMLAKCAEALALRRAFPSLLHGVYTAEEMEQANTATVETVRVVEAPAINAPAETPQSDPHAIEDTNPAQERPGLLDGIDEPYEPKAGDPCLDCRKTRLSTGIYRVAKGGPMKGQLQCNGRTRAGEWVNHPAPIVVSDEIASDPTEIPW